MAKFTNDNTIISGKARKMNILQKLLSFFKRNNTTTVEHFGSTEEERMQFFLDLGEVKFKNESISIANYPFKNSILLDINTLDSKTILNISTSSAPPTIKIANELLFISGIHKSKLESFANRNNIPLIDRPNLWDWILEPFLDTEFSDETKNRTYNLLEQYNLTQENVDEIRESVRIQMLKYNFDTMLWEWVMFGPLDVLQAMKPKLNEEEFNGFYNFVMEVALRPDELKINPATNTRL